MFSRLVGRVFPTRASTQTWMILTFLFFVGIAVVSVGLYITFVLKNEVQIAYQQTMFQQVSHISSLLEDESSNVNRLIRMRTMERMAGIKIDVVVNDSLVLGQEGVQSGLSNPLFDLPEMQFTNGVEVNYAERKDESEHEFFIAMKRPASGMIIRISQPSPLLYDLIRRLQFTMVAAMVMALLLSVFGSWIAAQRVTEPLLAIRNSAKSISEGHFEEEIIVESRASEFHDLAKSLNLMSDSFREKIDELQRMAHLQNEFIGNVSHEVRNPIFAVGGYLEALASATLTADQRRFYAEKGLNNLERLNNLFNDLIEIARLEYREDLIKSKVFELSELLGDVYEVLKGKAEEKNIQLVVENPVLFVRADRSRIRQVLINLIDNAIAYSDTGTVRCRYRRHLDKVRIEVVDSGRGIPEEHLERIFERFHRVDPDRSRKSGGTGLGLSIVKQILAAHGETVHVESTLGRGTRFWFELQYEETLPDELEA